MNISSSFKDAELFPFETDIEELTLDLNAADLDDEEDDDDTEPDAAHHAPVRRKHIICIYSCLFMSSFKSLLPLTRPGCQCRAGRR